MTRQWKTGVLLFVLVLTGLTLVSWSCVLRPSMHFHFIDMAESFLHGRLDTLTPFRTKGAGPLPGDPAGLSEAVDRQLSGGGWNDWSSYFEITLTEGERYAGVWPWKLAKPGQKSFDRKDTFVTLAGDHMMIRPSDAAMACEQTPPSEPELRQRWQQQERWEQRRELCLKPLDKGQSCPAGTRPFPCLNKRYYISFPPGPAVAMLPFVAVWEYRFNDVVFTLVFAALCAVVLLLLLRLLAVRGQSGLTELQRLELVFLFVFGTVFFFSAVRGEVWFTALILGVFFHLLYLYAAWDLRHPFLAGLALAAAFSCRTTMMFSCVFIGLLVLLHRRPWDRPGVIWRVKNLAAFAAPCVVVGLGLAVYNYARFGRPGEFGHLYLAEGTRDSIASHGMFSVHFLARNLAAAFTNLPSFVSHWPYVKISGHGLSLLVTTPVFLYLLWPRRGSPEQEGLSTFRWPLRRILWLSAAAIAVPILLYQNTGWLQFGYRFSLDFMPYLFLLFALDRRPRGAVFHALVAWSFAVNLFGAIIFQRFPAFFQ